jgi:hypothetical protein
MTTKEKCGLCNLPSTNKSPLIPYTRPTVHEDCRRLAAEMGIWDTKYFRQQIIEDETLEGNSIPSHIKELERAKPFRG